MLIVGSVWNHKLALEMDICYDCYKHNVILEVKKIDIINCCLFAFSDIDLQNFRTLSVFLMSKRVRLHPQVFTFFKNNFIFCTFEFTAAGN